ncbi:MFS Git1p-related glycerophosphoinositol and glycerophosphocholine permease [Macrolepiota fuliginosa MF-IS2]|uniref:MFS Git1p-related glycerophosphoinositol and glycerophosphocholine permease n=1 Tax=Macrolepiota fuliginosa MF-IS2 TaxID=1400762 RepID=A0A9P6C455_9AGAR|nr:MFS Git1p-related glycerophosphoinositol and glycerophosphocholine permease [Macrolepiota fuliginosa MF-IS2]
MTERIKGVSLIFACGTALFADGYSNGIISSVNTLLTRIYDSDRIEAHNYGTTVRSVAFAGTVVGMIIFGWLSDKMGRKSGMMSATIIVALFSGLSSASKGAHGSLGGMLSMLSAMRFLLGIGIGAEYPCGSVSAAEQSEGPSISKSGQHQWLALATNCMIDLGVVVAAFIPLALVWIFGEDHLRVIWRLSLGLGMVPALFVFFWRMNMEEPECYKKGCMKYTEIPYGLVFKRYWASLMAISFVWFMYDIIAYPFGIYTTTILDNVTGGTDSLKVIFGWNVVINLFYIPGTVGGAFVLDYLDPKMTLIVGLVLQAIIGFIMSGLYAQLTNHIAAFAVVYGIFLSLGELGPGNCTIIIASKTSATAVRGQYYGIAAAVGKIGAFVGTWVFPPIVNAFGGPTTTRGNTGPFWIGSALALFSAVIVLFFVQPVPHDGLIEEDRAFREYLEAHGYDTSMMGLGLTSDVHVETPQIDVKMNRSLGKNWDREILISMRSEGLQDLTIERAVIT